MPYGVAWAAGKLWHGVIALLCTLMLSVSVASADTVRLAMLGDSLTQGYGLNEGEGLVPQLQAWLRDAGHDVELLNAGVSGDTTAGGLSRLDWTLGDNPDAFVVALGGNDLLRGIDPATSRANLAAILERLRAEGLPVLLTGMPAPGNYGPEWRDAFAAIYPELAEEFDVTLHPDLLGPITVRQQAGEAFADLMQGDNIHPNPQGVALIVEALGPTVSSFLRDIEAGS